MYKTSQWAGIAVQSVYNYGAAVLLHKTIV